MKIRFGFVSNSSSSSFAISKSVLAEADIEALRKIYNDHDSYNYGLQFAENSTVIIAGGDNFYIDKMIDYLISKGLNYSEHILYLN